MISNLQQQHKRLQKRIDAAYVDKLDGDITHEFFDKKSKEWRREQLDILRRFETHQNANCYYIDEGVEILELAHKAVDLYEKQEIQEKRKLVDFVFSNSSWKDEKLHPTYRKPFDLIVEACSEQAEKDSSGGTIEDDGTSWLPRLDYNQSSSSS